MSFESLKLAELQFAAKEFDIKDLDSNATRREIIAALKEAGRSWQNYKKFIEPKLKEKKMDEIEPSIAEATIVKSEVLSVEAVPVQADEKFEETVLVKMERKNYRFDILGYTFTADHPYKVMSEDDAYAIMDAEDGFRIATGREAREYYS